MPISKHPNQSCRIKASTRLSLETLGLPWLDRGARGLETRRMKSSSSIIHILCKSSNFLSHPPFSKEELLWLPCLWCLTNNYQIIMKLPRKRLERKCYLHLLFFWKQVAESLRSWKHCMTRTKKKRHLMKTRRKESHIDWRRAHIVRYSFCKIYGFNTIRLWYVIEIFIL